MTESNGTASNSRWTGLERTGRLERERERGQATGIAQHPGPGAPRKAERSRVEPCGAQPSRAGQISPRFGKAMLLRRERQ